jgi:Recombination enhancement, RecA-dependent nuclease
MNLTGRPVYIKGGRRQGKKVATALIRRYWKAVVAVGCIVKGLTPCEGRITIHHCGTGAGGRKDHKKVIPLCWGHHLGSQGIDGKRMSKREWQHSYGTELVLLKRLERLLALPIREEKHEE